MTNITVCDKHIQIVTNTEKERKQKNFYGDIEALADARRALKNLVLNPILESMARGLFYIEVMFHIHRLYQLPIYEEILILMIWRACH